MAPVCISYLLSPCLAAQAERSFSFWDSVLVAFGFSVLDHVFVGRFLPLPSILGWAYKVFLSMLRSGTQLFPSIFKTGDNFFALFKAQDSIFTYSFPLAQFSPPPRFAENHYRQGGVAGAQDIVNCYFKKGSMISILTPNCLNISDEVLQALYFVYVNKDLWN